MPYDPHQEYRGDQYIYGGLSQLGQGVGQAIQGYQQAQQEQAADDTILKFAQQQGLVTPDMQQQYLTGNSKQKAGIIAGITRGFAMNMQQQQMEAQQQQRQAMAQELGQRAADYKAQADQRAADLPYAHTGIWTTDSQGNPIQAGVYDGSGKPTMFNNAIIQGSLPGGRNGQLDIQPYIDPNTGQPVAGMGIIKNPNGTFRVVTNPDARPRKQIQPLTPAQIKTAFNTFDVNASDIANSANQQGIDAQGNPVEPGVTPTSIQIKTDKGNRIVPYDSFQHLKSLVTNTQPPATQAGANSVIDQSYQMRGTLSLKILLQGAP